MNSKRWVISLGGSRIVQEEVDTNFLEEFRKLINLFENEKFVVVTGGGTTARKYINALGVLNEDLKKQSDAGILITRYHAQFLMKLFGKEANHTLPLSVNKVKELLKKNKIVFCGALRRNKQETTDAASARIAAELKCPFINITNVKGLYDSDPKKNKNAKLVELISWNDFNCIAEKIKYKPGQNFILDQKAAKIIKKEKVKTFIVGSLKELKNILEEKEFVGTKIEG